MADDDSLTWNVDLEVSLFHAMRRHKPVGVNRHFQMMVIHEKLNNSVSKLRISAKQIWDHLSTMYDLQALNESEIAPFPNKETDFILPRPEFGSLLSEDFPRVKESTGSGSSSSSVDDTSSKESSAKPEKDSRDSAGKSSRPSAVEKAAERLQEVAKYDDSPRRERKRTRGTTQSPAPSTRGSTQSPAPSTENTPTTKRARRI